MNETDALLEQLRGIKPPQVSWIPATGWWILGLLLVVALFAAWIMYRSYQQRAWVRQAQRELEQIRQQSDRIPVGDSIAGVSRLAKRVALAARGREDVASLHGDRWLRELDTICGRELFSQGHGRMLESAPYQQQTNIKEADLHGLFDVMSELIKAAGRRKTKATAS